MNPIAITLTRTQVLFLIMAHNHFMKPTESINLFVELIPEEPSSNSDPLTALVQTFADNLYNTPVDTITEFYYLLPDSELDLIKNLLKETPECVTLSPAGVEILKELKNYLNSFQTVSSDSLA